MSGKLVRIGDIPHDPTYKTAYRRKNGDTYQKLGEKSHIPVKWLEMKGFWKSNGARGPELFDPDELVEFIPERSPAPVQPAGFV